MSTNQDLSDTMQRALLWITDPRSLYGGDWHPLRGCDVPRGADVRTFRALERRGLAETNANNVRATEEGKRLAKQHRAYVEKRDRLIITIEEMTDLGFPVYQVVHVASALDSLHPVLHDGLDPVATKAVQKYT